jgi:hypothetical protein
MPVEDDLSPYYHNIVTTNLNMKTMILTTQKLDRVKYVHHKCSLFHFFKRGNANESAKIEGHNN